MAALSSADMETQDSADALFAQISDFQCAPSHAKEYKYLPLYYRAVLRRVKDDHFTYDRGLWFTDKNEALKACARLRIEGFPDRCILLERLDYKPDAKERAKVQDYDPEWRVVKI